jgi:hypothetical protein
MAWMKKNENVLVDMGAPLGKTKRVTAAVLPASKMKSLVIRSSKLNRTMLQQQCLSVTRTSTCLARISTCFQ